MTLPLGQFVTVWAFLAINIASPGPNVINTIALAMGSGRGAGIGSACGVGLGIGLWCLGMSLGMAGLFAAMPQARVIMTMLAVGLLVLFATRYLLIAWRGWRGQAAALTAGRGGLSFWAGFRRSLAVNALNPKALTSWLAVLALFPVARAAPGDIAVLCAGACALAFGLHAAYALLFSTDAAARAYLRIGWMISGAAGLFFSVFAVKLGVSLIRQVT